MSQNSWGNLANHFDVYKENPEQGVLDNIEATWEFLSPLIHKESKILDFGCGTGGLCQKLHLLKHKVTGFDQSPEMIQIAKEKANKKISFYSGSLTHLPPDQSFDLIIAMMVLQFIEFLPEALEPLIQRLEFGGILWFSVHYEKYIDAANTGTNFTNHKTVGSKKLAIMTLGNQSIQIYSRTLEQYIQALQPLDLELVGNWLSKPKSPDRPPKYHVFAFKKL